MKVRRPKLDGGASSVDPTWGRYARFYTLGVAAGQTLVQEVRTEVRYLGAGEVLAEYQAVYAEYFRSGPEAGERMRDLHDFDLRRDGWTQEFMRMLLQRFADEGAISDYRGPLEVHYRKDLLLGVGRVDGAEPVSGAKGGSEFGFLNRGPLEESAASLSVARKGGGTLRVQELSPFPRKQPGAGSGWFEGTQGWRACESLRYVFATMTGSFDDGGGYEPVELPGRS